MSDSPIDDTSPPAHCRLTLLSRFGQQELSVRRGLGLQAIANKHATGLEFDCREADCGICLIEVVTATEASLSPPTAREKEYLKALRAEAHERLACQCRLMGDVTLRIPDP